MFKLLITAVLLGLVLSTAASGQSRDQNFPTSVSGPEISGIIKARDVGDSRLTSYFYAFDGAQGDLFINVLTKNFSGDIDVFTRDTLRPLTKMVIFGDGSRQSETGRVIYLRKPERLILRIQGRTPNDEAAAYQIKFAGAFVAVQEKPTVEEPKIARAETEEKATVNSVGTILVLPPQPSPAPAEKNVPTERTAKETRPPADVPPSADRKTAEASTPPPRKPEVVIKSAIKEGQAAKSPPARRTTTARKTPPVREASVPDPLASINLRIQLKTGDEILRPLNEVLKFSVDKGVLTVIMKSGSINRYSMVTEVSRVTIE